MIHKSKCVSYGSHFDIDVISTSGNLVQTDMGDAYSDLIMGCGSLPFGHTNRFITEAVTGVMDIATTDMLTFMNTLDEQVLAPRNMDYCIQFTGPTGTNAVEAAIKLARIKTGRRSILSLDRCFHGCSAGSLGLTNIDEYHAGLVYRPVAGEIVAHPNDDCTELLNAISGGHHAAVILEVVQGDSLKVIPSDTLHLIQATCNAHGTLLIIDDVQAGAGRCDKFFSFDSCPTLSPDIIIISKGIANGLPLSFLLSKPVVDNCWIPGQHSGTFRAHGLSLAAANKVVPEILEATENRITVNDPALIGKGHMLGVKVTDGPMARDILFDYKILVELCDDDYIVKFMPPIDGSGNHNVYDALRILRESELLDD